MSFLARPFAALRAHPDHAASVAAPPYDVMSRAEAKTLAGANERSFLRISRAEIELSDATDAYAEDVYARAATNLQAFEAAGYLVRDAQPGYYVYRVGNGTHKQTGIAFAASVDAYRENRIRRHELTRPAKESDRVRQIDAINAQTGPVLLAHRDNAALAAAIDAQTQVHPALEAEVDGWRHQVWQIDSTTVITELTNQLNGCGAFYIADGHHRSAAAERVCSRRGGGEALAHHGFLAVSFPASTLRILDYNRVVRDLNGRSPQDFLCALETRFEITPSPVAISPRVRHTYGLYVGQQWFELKLHRKPAADDPVEQLDVRVLDAAVLEPLLGISDPRTDDRIDFIGGSRGTAAIEARVHSGDMTAGFTLCPTLMDDLMAVADAGLIMPPKSTWFEPKLADGLLSLPLD